MHLSIDEVSRLLNLPKQTVQRWIRQGKIPVYGFRGEYILLEKDLRKWAQSQGIVVSSRSNGAAVKHPIQTSNLHSAMKKGGVVHGIRGNDVAGVLKAVVEAAPLDPSVDRAQLFARLIEREELSTTGIGRGVAIPHPRTPLRNGPEQPSITTCFMDAPVDYDSIDGLPVFVLFLMLSPSPNIHLRLLAKLSHLLRDRSFVDFLRSKPTLDKLLSQVDEIAVDLDVTNRSSEPANAF